MMKMLRYLGLSLRLLPRRRRWHWAALVPLGVAAAGAEAAGAAGVFLLVAVLNDPVAALESSSVASLHQLLGAPEGTAFVVSTTALLTVFYILKNLYLAWVIYVENRLFQRTTAELSRELLNSYLEVPYTFHLRRNSAELIHRVMEGTNRVVNLVLGSTVYVLSEVLVVAGILVVMFVAAPVVTLVVVGVLGTVVAATILLLQRRFFSLGEMEVALRKAALRTVQHTFDGLKEIRVFGRESYYRGRFSEQQSEIARLVTRLRFGEQLPRLTVEALFVGATLLVVVLIVARSEGALEVVPVLGLYAYAGFRVIPSFNRMVHRMNNFWYGTASVEDLAVDFERLRGAESMFESGAEPAVPLPFHDRIVFQGVSYAYERDLVLQQIDLTIPKGAAVGLVGATGVGKSTLVDLLLGLLEPSQGSIRVDGQDIGSNLAAWRRQIGYVPQNLFLIDDTLRRNVAFALEESEIDDYRVASAIELAGLAELVDSLPEGLETRVGERGIRLSGGQKQRITIARALYHEPEVLIFDEATSALDGQSERELSVTLRDLRGERTLIVIAHRLTTIQSSDRLVFLREGRVASEGTYQELVEGDTAFRRVVGLE